MENPTPLAENGHGDACLLQVGQEVYPVYGSVEQGWSVERLDVARRELAGFRYRSLEEIFFALINFSLCPVGKA